MPTAMAFSRLHRAYLTQNKPDVLAELEKSQALSKHLSEVGETAMQMYDAMSAQMMNSPNLPVEHAQRAEALSQIPLTVEEVVLEEVIFQPR